MAVDNNILERIDALYDRGRDFVEGHRLHGGSADYQFDLCAFDGWRRKVNDLLFSLGSCEEINYRMFSKEVTRPDIRDLQRGLRILANVRDDYAKKSH